MESKCTICGSNNHNTAFHDGYVCEDCLNYIRHIDGTPIVSIVDTDKLFKDDYDAKP